MGAAVLGPLTARRAMSFAISGGDYDRFMGRYSERLAPAFADFAGVEAGLHVLDVGAAQMRRVVRDGGTVAACTWAAGDGMEMLRVIWGAAAQLVDPTAGAAESRMRYRTREELAELAAGASLRDVEIERLPVEASYEGFDDFWAPVTAAPGPVGAFYARLDDDPRAQVREECCRRLGDPSGPFTLAAAAWAVRGRS